jgi:hypothetical protein
MVQGQEPPANSGFGYSLPGAWGLFRVTATAGSDGLFEVTDTELPPPPPRYYRTTYP